MLTFESVGVECFGSDNASRDHVGSVSANDLVHLVVHAILHRVLVCGPRHLQRCGRDKTRLILLPKCRTHLAIRAHFTPSIFSMTKQTH